MYSSHKGSSIKETLGEKKSIYDGKYTGANGALGASFAWDQTDFLQADIKLPTSKSSKQHKSYNSQ